MLFFRIRDEETSFSSETPNAKHNEGGIKTNTIPNESDHQLDDKQVTPTVKKRISKRLQLRFTKEEDRYLREGLLRHGNGQWTAILRDKAFKFQTGRKADSLRKRAESKFPTLCK